ncbi:hypothetical protein J3Q64DRAFT_1638918, partial [Phycomyces blakesleeanus]
LQPTSGPSTYDFVYLSCKRFYKYNEVCKMISILKISQSRILDIHCPAHRVIELLVHGDFKSKLIDLFHKQKIVPIAHFSPLDGKIICDPKLALESLDVHASKAQELFDNRILRMCLHQPAYLGNNMMHHFSTISINRVSATTLAEYLTQRKTIITTLTGPNIEDLQDTTTTAKTKDDPNAIIDNIGDSKSNEFDNNMELEDTQNNCMNE